MLKFIGKSALLTGIAVGILFLLSPVFVPKWVEGHAGNGGTYMTTTTQGFYALEEDSLDVLLVGSSQVLRDVDARALTERGISAYSRATTVQAPTVTYYYVEDAFKSQNPQVVLADFSFLYDPYVPDQWEAYIRYAFDWMPFTPEKMRAAAQTLKGSEEQNLLDYALPALYYHDRWKELDPFDVSYLFLEDKSDPNRGSILLDDAAPQEFSPLTGNGAQPAAYSDSLFWYGKTMDLCREKGVDLVMLRLPRPGWTEERHAADAALAEQYGVPLLDFNREDLYREVGLDAQTDFYDKGHLDRAGAQKLTDWLGDWLTEHGYGGQG